METLNAAEILNALGHESRLAIFRLLVEAGPEGINASAIGDKLGIPNATLSFHLSHLSRVGLIKGETGKPLHSLFRRVRNDGRVNCLPDT